MDVVGKASAVHKSEATKSNKSHDWKGREKLDPQDSEGRGRGWISIYVKHGHH